MSRDPLEELFGPLEPDDANETPETAPVVDAPAPAAPVAATSVFATPVTATPMAAAPVPAPRQAAPVPAPTPAPVSAPVRQTWDELQTAPVPAGGKRPTALLPWIIVGGVTVLALIGSLIFISTLNGSGETKPETSTEPSETAPDTEAPATDPAEETPDESTNPTPEVTKPPKVDVGNTIPMDIEPAGISVEASNKLEPNRWFVVGGDTNRVTWESNLMNSFPDSCAAMRSPSLQSPWGIEQDPTGKWIVVRPEGTCAAAPDLYDQVWGLMQALADSAKPLEG